MKKLLLLILPLLLLTACGAESELTDNSASLIHSNCPYVFNIKAHDALVTFLGGDDDEFSEDFKLHLKEQGCSSTDIEQIKKDSDALRLAPKAPPVNADRLMNVDHGIVTSRDCYRGTCYVKTDHRETRYIDDPYWTYKNPFPPIGERWLEDADSYQAHVKTLTVDEWALEKGLTK